MKNVNSISDYVKIWSSQLKEEEKKFPSIEMKEKLLILENQPIIDIIEFIDSDKYLNMKEIIFPKIKWILDVFYNPQKYKALFFDEGIPEQELDSLFFNELILILGMKCITLDSYILTEKGLLNFREIFEQSNLKFKDKEFKNYKIEVFSKDSPVKTGSLYKNGFSKTLNIATDHGFSLEGTLNHPIFCRTQEGLEFKNLEDIDIGDWVVIQRGQNYFGNILDISYAVNFVEKEKLENRFIYSKNCVLKNDIKLPKILSKELASLLGYWVSEGSYNNKNLIGFCNTDKDIVLDFIRKFEIVFSVRPICVEEKQIKGRKIVYSANVNSKYIRTFLYALGLDFVKTNNKTVPKAIRQASKDIVAAFLRSYFEGDGGVGAREIGCGSMSEELMKQIQLLLLNFGIIAKKWAKKVISGNKYVDFHALGFCSKRNVKIFYENIGFESEKRNNFKEFFMIKKSNGRGDKIPFLKDLFENLKIQIRQILRSKYNTKRIHNKLSEDEKILYGIFHHRNYKSHDYALTYFTCAQISEYCKKCNIKPFDLSQLEEIVSENFFYDKVIEKINNNKKYADTVDFEIPKVHNFFSNGFISHNSGKSLASAVVIAYELYKLLMLENPQIYYGFAPNEQIFLRNYATSSGQAKDTVFAKFKILFEASPWFREYKKILEDYRQFDENSSEFCFSHKNIIVRTEHSRSPGLVGMIQKVGVCDEIARMEDTGGIRSGERVWTASKTTTKPFKEQGINLAVSSPDYEGDFLWQLTEQAYALIESKSIVENKIKRESVEKRVKTRLAFRFPTWEINVNLGFDSFAQDILADPASFWRDFGTIFGARTTAWCPNSTRIEDCIDRDNPVSEDGRILARGYPEYTYYFHGDPGQGRPARFGFAVGHLEKRQKKNLRTQEDETIAHIVIDLVYAFEASESEGEIDFEAVERFILDICDLYSIEKGTFDKWQNIFLRQRLQREMGIKIEDHVVDKADYDELLNAIYEKRISFPNYNLLLQELRRLQIVKDRIEKGENFTKDIADCVAALAKNMFQISFRKRPLIKARKSIGLSGRHFYGSRMGYRGQSQIHISKG